MIKILEHSPSRLRYRTTLHPLLKVLLWLLALGMLLGFCPSYSLTLKKANPDAETIQISAHRKLFGISLSTTTFQNIQEATLRRTPKGSSSRSSRRSGDTFKMLFVTEQRLIPLQSHYTAGRKRQEEAVQKINSFIQQSAQQSATVHMGISPLIWLATGFLSFVALGGTFGSWKECVVDKTQRTVQLASPTLIGRKRETYNLSEVSRFKMTTQTSYKSINDSNTLRPRYRKTTRYGISMELQNGDEVTLASIMTSWGKDKLQQLANMLEKFRQSSSPDSVGTSVQPAPANSSPSTVTKPCAVCGGECDGLPRYQDHLGRYYHKACYTT